jgi:hypothetical protein
MEDYRAPDRKLAIRWMGWTWDETRCRVCGWPFVAPPGVGCTPDLCSELPPRQVTLYDACIPPFHTSDADAWMLLLAIMLKIRHSRAVVGVYQDGIRCTIYGDAQQLLASESAATLALAVCAAAEQIEVEATHG